MQSKSTAEHTPADLDRRSPASISVRTTPPSFRRDPEAVTSNTRRGAFDEARRRFRATRGGRCGRWGGHEPRPQRIRKRRPVDRCAPRLPRPPRCVEVDCPRCGETVRVEGRDGCGPRRARMSVHYARTVAPPVAPRNVQRGPKPSNGVQRDTARKARKSGVIHAGSVRGPRGQKAALSEFDSLRLRKCGWL